MWRAVLGDAHVAGGDALHRALVVVEHFGRGKARIDFDAERLGLARQPAAHIAERADIAVMIVHQRRHDEVRQPDRAARRHPVEAVVLDLGLQRAVGILAPVRNELVERRPDRSPRRTEYARRPRSPSPPRRSLRSALSCFSRIAAARPDGPAPTITTSNSMDSRGGKFFGAHDLISARLRTASKGRLFPIFPGRTTMEMHLAGVSRRPDPS